jgi:hypothetical protein
MSNKIFSKSIIILGSILCSRLNKETKFDKILILKERRKKLTFPKLNI